MNNAKLWLKASIKASIISVCLQPIWAIAQTGVIQEVLPTSSNQPPEARLPNSWGAAVRLAPNVLSWLTDSALQYRIKTEIDKLRPDALRRLPQDGGVLIVAGVAESKSPDTNGNRQRYFLDAYIAGIGTAPRDALEKFLNSDRLDTAPPSGFTRRDTLFWLTHR